MIRTQIQLTEEQAQALREIASQRGISMAEAIREAVAEAVRECEQDEKWGRALAIMGRFREDQPDVSTNHDKYLAEDYL